jgi:multisubunit Na+/H+ antiporter MnhE subunit
MEGLKTAAIGAGLAISVIVCGFVGYLIGKRFDLAAIGLAVGLFLGFFGWLYQAYKTHS